MMIRAFQKEITLPFEWRLQHYEVVDSRGKVVAPVLDLLYDDAAKAVRYVMIEVGGAVGISGKRILMPPDLFTRAGSGQLLCEASTELIGDAPPIENAEHPTPEEEKAIFDYFEKEPYWETKELKKKKEAEKDAQAKRTADGKQQDEKPHDEPTKD
ncbi:MAG: PRC-barrel domain-containing protein [Nitrospinae bacterium]|nr:PRC-barrel domain-containing protein [Nitrospinota bacterium]